MIIEVKIRNCTSTILNYHVLGVDSLFEELENDYSIPTLPGMYPSAQKSGFNDSNIYNEQVEMLTTLNWTPNFQINTLNSKSKIFPYQPNLSVRKGEIPCNMITPIFLPDINYKIRLYCQLRNKFYIADLDVYSLMNFNVYVGLTRNENLNVTNAKWGKDANYLTAHNRDPYGYIMLFDCRGNTLMINDNESNYYLQGLTPVPRHVYMQFIKNSKFSINEYLTTSKKVIKTQKQPYLTPINNWPGKDINQQNYRKPEDYDIRNIDYFNRNFPYVTPDKKYYYSYGLPSYLK